VETFDVNRLQPAEWRRVMVGKYYLVVPEVHTGFNIGKVGKNCWQLYRRGVRVGVYPETCRRQRGGVGTMAAGGEQGERGAGTGWQLGRGRASSVSRRILSRSSSSLSHRYQFRKDFGDFAPQLVRGFGDFAPRTAGILLHQAIATGVTVA
jgi:hypothetical protein